jgi:hypothetical protein
MRILLLKQKPLKVILFIKQSPKRIKLAGQDDSQFFFDSINTKENKKKVIPFLNSNLHIN